uniref:General secretion pathway protein D n=1 Tax=uncultured Thiotrichaceae bacterium TaxID=298394 RepID=A0A6S6SRY6_9GAMM|nr:MAG: General secretion pathway protein D [uncultured Thiotrichaceae bacterium]
MMKYNNMKLNKAWLSVAVAAVLWGAAVPSLQAESSRINLQNTEIRTLVETVSKLTGKNFIIDPAVRGNITFVSGDGLSKDELYETFLSILQVHGLEAIEVGSVIKILPLNKARSQVAPIVSTTPAPAKAGQPAPPRKKVEADRTVTQVFTLQYIPVNTAIQTLQPLAGQGETRIQFNQASNAVIVTGRKQNVDRLGAVIKSIDKPNNQGFELVALRYSVANQLANTLRGLMASGKSADGGAIPQRVYISVDERTNSILVAGGKADREKMRQVIAKLDIPRTQPSATQVVRLKHADATKLLNTLKQLQIAPAAEGGAAVKQARIAVDESTNSIIISGEREDREPILAAIARLDVPPTKPPASGTQVVPIKYAVATQIIQTLKQLQITPTAKEGGQTVEQVRMAADERTNSVLLSGNREEYAPIIAAIRQLDTPKSRAGGTRVIRLRYAQAEELVAVLKETATSVQKQTEGTAAAGANAAAAANSNNEVSIQADKTTNSVIITAPQHLQVSLQRVISQLDQRRPQVMVEAIIAEVSTDLSNKFGFGIVADGISGGDTGVAGYSNFGGLSTALGLASGATSIPGGFLLGAGSEKFGVVLEALKGDGATNILSTPTLVTLDNEEASIVVGQNVPFVTGSYTSTDSSADNPFQTITREDVGLTLKVTPQINRDKTITMKIDQETSTLSTSSSASDVITNKRSINTNVMVEDGQVLVLGGLIQDDFNDSETKVPVLSDLPIIGKAFRGNTTTKKKQNLMVFIHPVIMADRQAADAYTRAKYHTLQKQQKQSKILNRGSLTGNAAVFPDIECIDGHCATGSADDLHFNTQAVPQRGISGALRQPYQPARPLNPNESAAFVPNAVQFK